MPRDYRERILKLGYSPKRVPEPVEKIDPETGEIHNGFDDNPCAELNSVAIKNLLTWVPDLSLYKCRRRVGRFASYEAVATWRESTTGKKLEDRELNLKISGRGIRDFGDDRGYSALDLVMAARSCGLTEAFEWLEQRVLPKTAGVEIDFDKIMQTQDAPSVVSETDTKEDPDKEIQELLKIIGPVWQFGDVLPPNPPMLIPYFVPRLPVLGYLYGQWGSFKTFIADDLAIAIASGGKFAGQQVTKKGYVLQIELESTFSELRAHAAAKVRGIDSERLPLDQIRSAPPTILGGRHSPNAKWGVWAKRIVRYAKLRARLLGVPLALITMDPQNRFAGFTDEDNSAEGALVTNALIAMAEDAGCPVLVVDHLGKNAERDQRGTSVKQQAPFFRINAGETAKDIQNERHLVLDKMKDGEDKLAVSFRMKKITVERNQMVIQDDGTEKIESVSRETLAIDWDDKIVPAALIGKSGGGELSDLETLALRKLAQLINKEGSDLPAECGATQGLKGVGINRWFLHLRDRRTFERGNAEREFKKLQIRLQSRGEIDVCGDWVWIPLS